MDSNKDTNTSIKRLEKLLQEKLKQSWLERYREVEQSGNDEYLSVVLPSNYITTIKD